MDLSEYIENYVTEKQTQLSPLAYLSLFSCLFIYLFIFLFNFFILAIKFWDDTNDGDIGVL